jgi:hypothetical protein
VMTNDWVDLLLIDLGAKNKHAAMALPLLQRKHEDCGAIVLGDKFEEDTFFNLYDAGAKDYLVKPVPAPYLVSRLLLALDALHEQQRCQHWETLLTGLNVLTPLSKAYNKVYFQKLLQLELEKMAAMPTQALPFGVLMVRVLPPTLELPGEELETNPLRGANLEHQLGKVFRQSARSKDTLGQWDENTYTFLLPNTKEAGVTKALNRLLEALNKAATLPLETATDTTEEQGLTPANVAASLQWLEPSTNMGYVTAEQLLEGLASSLQQISLPSAL